MIIEEMDPSNQQGLGERLRKACMGRASAAGGLDVIDFKNELVRWFPQEDKDKILTSRRKDLHSYCTALLEYQVQVEQQQSQSANYSGGIYDTMTSTYTPATIYTSPYTPPTTYRHATRDSSGNDKYKIMPTTTTDTSSVVQYSDKNKRWCRCVAHVAEKGGTYNPYAVCTHSVGRDGQVSCQDYYRNEYHLPEGELDALAELKGKTPEEYSKVLGY